MRMFITLATIVALLIFPSVTANDFSEPTGPGTIPYECKPCPHIGPGTECHYLVASIAIPDPTTVCLNRP
ncbi:MAG: hypothetical protein ACYC2H_04570 [Thermoplasmatota archaeon]